MSPSAATFAPTTDATNKATDEVAGVTYNKEPRCATLFHVGARSLQSFSLNGAVGTMESVQKPRGVSEKLERQLASLYAESVTAKIWHTATKALYNVAPPEEIPQYIEPHGTTYVHSPAEFWTSGFFPGCLAALYQRNRRWKHHRLIAAQRGPHELTLQHACRWWSDALHRQAKRTDEHDLGFMIQPWAQPLWELDGDKRAFASLVTAAVSLASRFDPRIGAIRSWDTCFTARYQYDDPSKDYLVIIDSLMNINLLYYVARQTNDERLSSIARTHALTLIKSHIREDYSTYHVVNFDPGDGTIKERITNQGFSDESCWARGQAWAITGYAQIYGWERDSRFLDISCRLADYYISHLSEDSIPSWDFSAPVPGPKDTSSAMIAAYGLLILHEHLQASTSKYLEAALRMVDAVLKTSMAPLASFRRSVGGAFEVESAGEETILLHSTINNYEFAPQRWVDHGLVYADYYFLLVGNKLLEMGLM